jgi:hypothetical protein
MAKRCPECGALIVTEVHLFNKQYISGWVFTTPKRKPQSIRKCLNGHIICNDKEELREAMEITMKERER